MFFGSDRSLLFASDFGPRSFGEDRPCEPAEVNCQIMQPSEIVPHAVSVRVQDCQQLCRGRLNQRFVADWVVRLAFESSGAASLRRRNSVRRHFVHHRLPSPGGHRRIVRREIRASQVEIDRRRSVRLVHRIEQAFGFAFVARAKRALLGRIIFLPIKISVTPAIQSVFQLHDFLHVEENARAEFFPLTSTRGVAAEFARIVSSVVDLLAIPLAFGS